MLIASCRKPPADPQTTSLKSSTNALADRSYACDTFNVTRTAGPYSATCELAGRIVTVKFTDSRTLVLSVDAEETDDGFIWDIRATYAASGDDWNLTIEDR